MEDYGQVPNEVERDRPNLSDMCPVRTPVRPPYPSLYPTGV
jgi:hypothetical protein